MGSVCGKVEQVSPREQAEKDQNAKIEQRLKKEKKADKEVPKLLLLGAGESGKSTIFKQIKVLFQRGFDDVERKNYRVVIHANVFQSIKILIDGCLEFSIENSEYNLQPKNKILADELSEIVNKSELSTLTPAIAKSIESLWRDAAIQKTFMRGNELQLPDCAKFFLDEIHRLTQPDYVPTQEDVLYARVRTTGIVETEFSPDSTDVYKLFDVGGQRSERRKWIHLFEGVTAVIFCAALSEYDQWLFEDENKNRMIEAKELFDWVLKQPWFEKASFLLFLNKFDIFERKILKTPLTVCDWFSDYKPSTTGRGEVEHAYEYVEQKFREIYKQNTAPANVERVFQVYRTTAVDRNLVKQTFTLVDEALTRKRLKEANLL